MADLETFPNPAPQRDYEIEIVQPEFTSVCPKTGHPDFGTIRVVYVPNRACVELKSFKVWLQSFRNRGIFYEAATNEILDTLVAALRPRRMTVSGEFTARGGIATNVRCTYEAGAAERGGAGGGGASPARAAARTRKRP
jgi:7-cyano-7-deazaguanine reductase